MDFHRASVVMVVCCDMCESCDVMHAHARICGCILLKSAFVRAMFSSESVAEAFFSEKVLWEIVCELSTENHRPCVSLAHKYRRQFVLVRESIARMGAADLFVLILMECHMPMFDF